MIYVARDRVLPSKRWLERASRERDAAAGFYSSAEVRGGRAFYFQLFSVPETRDLLRQLFRGKCAFCETRVDTVGLGDVEHFRPKTRAIDLDGTVVEPAYWWLASEWSNLYLSCQICNRNKANRFPVVGARARKPGEEAKEAALILDPCLDDPARYLVFGEDGLVASLPLDAEERRELGLRRYRAHDRAQITIDIFGLNRSDLVAARRAVAENVRIELDLVVRLTEALEGRDADAVPSSLRELLQRTLVIDDGAEYAALRRQLAAEFRTGAKTRLGLDPEELIAIVPADDLRVVTEEHKESAFQQLERHQIRVKTSSIEDDADKLIYRHTATIARVEIKNFKNIEELEFEFPLGSPERTGWKVLLGENGVGKSSALQAVALTLVGAKRARRFKDVNKARLLRDGARPAEGYVRVYMSADTDPLEMRITRRGLSFPDVGSRLRTFVVGFGAARWLPRTGSLRPEKDELIRIRNLFNPFVPLTDAREWLLELDRRQFNRAALPVLRLLERPQGDRLRRLQGRVVIDPVNPGSKTIPLEELSDGYQAMLAIAGEISEITTTRWPNVADAEGLVIVDEVGAHLHPRWKMRVVESMRRAFPRMQFLASTHDPLCLRGLDQGEILVMTRDEGELVVLDDLPGTENLRVDQLLTSSLFGLGSTFDPKTEGMFTEYYSLLAKRTLTPPERERLKELSATVGAEGVLGTTPRDQAIYQIVDEYLATRRGPSAKEWVSVSEDTKERVFDLLRTGDPAAT